MPQDIAWPNMPVSLYRLGRDMSLAKQAKRQIIAVL
jgi:hypothetical protein